jgi:GNAT superfamily N-acetyltransferase
MSGEATPDRLTPTLDFRRLSGKVRRGDFVCGEPQIDKWFEKAHRYHATLRTRVITAHLIRNQTIAGFYGLTIRLESDEDIDGGANVFRLQDKFFPAVHLYYIGVQRPLQGCGIGSLLMTHAIREFGQVAIRTGICALTLVAINEDRAKWYEQEWNFSRYGKPSTRPKMFFPAQAAINLIEETT